ncbi:HK97 family phage prohead protease [Hyphococcus sp.]|uniref:HK97 family phage prohead protease n=1 Tax=Hyphococcus sp. TaxID=2038636 RepID=UPI003D0BA048
MTALIAEIEGYASVFNIPDLNGDIVAPGAFAKSLQKNRKPALLYQHAAEAPIGRWLSLREDARGLFVRGELLLSSPRAREVHALLEGGAIDGLSIGYQTARSARVKSGRRILEANLWEVSVVTFPMASLARVTRIGSARPEQTPEDYAQLFKDSVRIPSSPTQHGMRAKRRAPASPSPSHGAGARHLADAVKRTAQKLTA